MSIHRLFVIALCLVVAVSARSALVGQEDGQGDGQANTTSDADNKDAADSSKKKKLEGKKVKELSLMDQDPFDLLILDEENKNAKLKIRKLENVPTNPKDTDKIRIVLVDLPDRKFDVFFEHIVEIRTYEQMVFAAAQELVGKKEYNEAYRHFEYLMRPYVTSGRTPPLSLGRAVRDFVYKDAMDAFDEKRYDYSLALLEELYRQGFDLSRVTSSMSRIADTLIGDAVANEDFRNARGILNRLSEQYESAELSALATWRQKLIKDAETRSAEAKRLLAAGKFREAQYVGRDMMKIWPDLPGARELTLEIAQKHPMVIVGVDQLSEKQSIREIANWAARRTGRLTQQTLLEFVGAGPEGGQYRCGFGSFEQNDYRTQLSFQMVPEDPANETVTGFDVARRLSALANPASPDYFPAWASLTDRISVHDVYRVDIDLRRPHVLPESMLQIVLHPDPATRPKGSPSEGAYVVEESVTGEMRFLANPAFEFGIEDHLKEIVEREFADPADAITALKRGDIDVIDQVFPADVPELQSAENIVVQTYASPTLHFLVPNYEKPFPSSQIFRRAMMYGINRQEIVNREILGNIRLEGFEIISGPFPKGTSENDPLAYAYDLDIRPRGYNPQLSVVLKEMSLREQKEIANRRGEEPPEAVSSLRIYYPQEQVARVGCQALAQYLKVVGLECEVIELPRGATRPGPDDDWDFFYTHVAVWEPIIDARRLLGPTGVARLDNEYVDMGLRGLDRARNWREARDRLHDLHRIVHEQVAVLPLWQTVNYCAYYRGLQGFGGRPVTLYQNAEQWKVVPRAPQD